MSDELAAPPTKVGEIDEHVLPQSGLGSPLQAVMLPRESTRRRLAYWLLGLVSACVIAAGIGMFIGTPDERLRDFVVSIFAPLITLTSTVFGFFYAARDS